MRTYKNINRIVLGTLVIIGMASCTSSYLDEGGLANANTPQTTYDYLATNRYQMFDTLIQIIDTLDLKEQINNAETFFAPSDNSIGNYLLAMTDTLINQTEVADTTYTLANLFEDATKEMILKYAVDEEITLANESVNGTDYVSLAGTEVTATRTLATDDEYYVNSDNPVYLLYFTQKGMADERCQTSGILTQNGAGTILHVLNNEHVFVFFSEISED